LNYCNLGESTKTALIELFFLEQLSILTKLPKSYAIDKISIQASVAPLKTTIIPEIEKRAVQDRVLRTAREMKKK